MNKYKKQIVRGPNQISQSAVQYDEKDNLKLVNYLNTISELQLKIHSIQKDNADYQTLEAWVQIYLKSNNKDSTQSTGLRPLLNASSKINILERQAIVGKKERRKQQRAVQANQQINNCSTSLHLRQILKGSSQNSQRVKDMQQAKRSLFNKIERILAQDEPYLHEKIMAKINRQVEKQKKIQTLKQLQSLCKEKQQAVGKHRESIVHKIDMKTIEQKVANNLNKMKQIMMKKLSNEEYKYEIVCSQQLVDRNVKKLEKSTQQMQNFIESKIMAMKQNEDKIEGRLKQIERKKQLSSQYIELDLNFIQNFQQIVQEGQRALSLPLKTQNSGYYLSQCDKLERSINQISRQQFKHGR